MITKYDSELPDDTKRTPCPWSYGPGPYGYDVGLWPPTGPAFGNAILSDYRGGDPKEADLRYIVAAVNACNAAGLSVEALEAGVLGGN